MSKAPVVPPEATPLEAFLNGQAVRAQEKLRRKGLRHIE